MSEAMAAVREVAETHGFTPVAVPARLDPASVARLAMDVRHGLADTRARGVIVIGGGDVFCLGMDVARMTAAEIDRDAQRRAIRTFSSVLLRLLQAKKPTVSIVAGAAMGGGVGLACACDVALALQNASFTLPEATLGFAPALIGPALTRRVSVATYRRLALLSESTPADQAMALGLVDEVCDSSRWLTRVAAVCRTLSRLNPRTKAMLARTASGPARAAMARATRDLSAAVATDDVAALVTRIQGSRTRGDRRQQKA